MRENILGKTGLVVTQLGYGAMELRGERVWGGREVSDEQAEQILSAVLDAGVNFIDTAPDYGLSEYQIGRCLAGRRRQFFLATKCGCNPINHGDHVDTPHLWSADNVRRNVEQSLARLRTDHVDILQLHNPSADDVDDRLLAELVDLRRRGLVKHLGVSTTLPHLDHFVEMGFFETVQVPYSCLQPEHEEAIARAADAGLGIIIRGAIARGGPESQTPREDAIELFERAGLRELLGDMTPAQFILRYTLSNPNCHTAIVGTTSLDHLRQNLQAAEEGPLPAELCDEIARRVKAAMAVAM